MSQTNPPTSRELLEMIQGDPEEVLREHTDLLEEMKEETDNETLADYIEARLDQFRNEDGGQA